MSHRAENGINNLFAAVNASACRITEKLGLQSIKTQESVSFHEYLISEIKSLTHKCTILHASSGPLFPSVALDTRDD